MSPLNNPHVAQAVAMCAVLSACNSVTAEPTSANAPRAPLAEKHGEVMLSEANASLEYEDEHEARVLNDSSDLRPPTMTDFEYQLIQGSRAREEFAEAFPNIKLPSRDDVDLLAVRWLTHGSGVVAQNHSSYVLSIAARFSAASPCEEDTIWKQVAPSGSAILGVANAECQYRSATVFIRDQQGFLVHSIDLTASEEFGDAR